MKKISLISFIILALGSMTFAQERRNEEIVFPIATGILVKNVTMKGDLMPVRGPAEDPITTTFEIEVEFCRGVTAKEFKVRAVTTLNNETTVEFLDTVGIDCTGPTERQTVKVKTTSIPFKSKIFVKNPLLVEEQVTR